MICMQTALGLMSPWCRCRLVCTAEGRPEELFATSRDGDAALFDAQQLEQLQFESAAEGRQKRAFHLSAFGFASSSSLQLPALRLVPAQI